MRKLIYTKLDVVEGVWDGKTLSVAGMTEFGAQNIALKLLAHMDGLSVWQIKQVLIKAESLLDCTTMLDCNSTAFVQASEGFRLACGE